MGRGGVRWLLGSLLLVVSGASEAGPSAACRRFDVPAQPLATALIAFGRQADVQVLTDGAAVARVRSPGIRGCLDARAALAGLLRGSGLEYTFTGTATVAVTPIATPSPAPGRGVAPARELAPVEADAMVARDRGFLAVLTSTASREDAALIDVPQSVSVVTRDLMDAQQAQSVADVVRNVAGVQAIDGATGLPSFQIRGFYTGNGLIDGMPSSIAGSGDFPPLIGLDRVEVFKGPQSILGDTTGNTFGGLLNVTLKQPRSRPAHLLQYALDDDGQASVGVDLTGPLSGYPGFDYRLVAYGGYADHSAQGYRNRRSGYLAPSLAWQDERTRLVVGAQRIANRLPTPDHLVLLGDRLSQASPFGLLPGHPGDYASYRTSRLYYLLDRQLDARWSWRSRGQYVSQRNASSAWTLADPQPDGQVLAVAQQYRYGDAYDSLQNDLVGTFTTAATEHTVTLGLDYARARVGHIEDRIGLYGNAPFDLYGGIALPPAASVLTPADDSPQPGSPWQTDTGLFVQDQWAIGEHWNLVGTARRSAYEVIATDPQGRTVQLHRSRWVPDAGLAYKPSPGITLYASMASGFQSLSYLGSDGRLLPPALSRQVEAGAKFELFDQQARLTLAAYRIRLDHSYLLVSAQQPGFASLGPGQTNRGAEVELVGRLAAGLDASLNYTNARIANRDGTAAPGAPRQRLDLWLDYRFQGVRLQGWGIGGGVRARSRSLGQSSDFSTWYRVPGQAELDFALSYRAPRWRVTLGAGNLLARRLYAADFDETFIPLRTRTRLRLTGSYDF